MLSALMLAVIAGGVAAQLGIEPKLYRRQHVDRDEMIFGMGRS
jgi:hypothetical protein